MAAFPKVTTTTNAHKGDSQESSQTSVGNLVIVTSSSLEKGLNSSHADLTADFTAAPLSESSPAVGEASMNVLDGSAKANVTKSVEKSKFVVTY